MSIGPGVLQFKSGFEAETKVVPFENMHRLVGKDHTTGFDWGTDLPAPVCHFKYLTGEEMPQAFVTTEIQTVEGREGKPTRALFMSVKKEYEGDDVVTRNEFSLFPDQSPGKDWKEGYVRYWMKLEDDFLERFPKASPNWRMMMEWKEPDSGNRTERGGTNNYRINIHIVIQDGRPLWKVTGQEVQPVRMTEWEEANQDHEVPVDRWFQVEAYMRKDAVDGRVYFAVDDQVICDRRCRTQHRHNPLPLRFWSIFKLYHGTRWLEQGPTGQWVDDVELWSSFPPGHPGGALP